MSETPPGGPPPEYQPYNRPGSMGGAPAGSLTDPDKLQALWDGYNKLSIAFVVNIVCAVPINLYGRTPGPNLGLILVALIILFFVVAAVSYPACKLVAVGKDWAPNNAILATVLIALNSTLCCGIIGFIVMQSIASKEMRKYGILKLSKRNIVARIDELRHMQGSTSTPGFSA